MNGKELHEVKAPITVEFVPQDDRSVALYIDSDYYDLYHIPNTKKAKALVLSLIKKYGPYGFGAYMPEEYDWNYEGEE